MNGSVEYFKAVNFVVMFVLQCVKEGSGLFCASNVIEECCECVLIRRNAPVLHFLQEQKRLSRMSFGLRERCNDRCVHVDRVIRKMSEKDENFIECGTRCEFLHDLRLFIGMQLERDVASVSID